MAEKVIVRVWKKEPKTPILIFPEWEGNQYRVQMWEFIGQHGEGDAQAVIDQTRPATDEEAELAIKNYEKYYDTQLTRIRRMPARK